MIKLKTKETNEIFEVTLDVANMSLVIKEMLDVLGEENIDDSSLTLPNVNSLVLKKVIEWLEQHKEDHHEEREEKEERRNDINEWDSHFFKVRSDGLIDMKVLNEMHVFYHSNYHWIHTFMSINVLPMLFLSD
jgi:hypothetical protein